MPSYSLRSTPHAKRRKPLRKPPKKGAIDAHAVYWIHRLRLQDWTVTVKQGTEELLEGAARDAYVEYTPDKRLATIFLRNLRYSDEIIADLVHELLHLSLCFASYGHESHQHTTYLLEQTIETLAAALLVDY